MVINSEIQKSIIDRVEEKGFRVDWNNGNYKVYEYSKEHRAYLFYGYFSDEEALKKLL